MEEKQSAWRVVLDIGCQQTLHIDSAFYPPWNGKTNTSQRAVMLCGWGVKAGMV